MICWKMTLSSQALEERISAALLEKKQTHFLHQNNTGITQNLSYIGG